MKSCSFFVTWTQIQPAASVSLPASLFPAVVVTLLVWCCNCDKVTSLCGCPAVESVNDRGSAAGTDGGDGREKSAKEEKTQVQSLEWWVNKCDTLTHKCHVNKGRSTVTGAVTVCHVQSSLECEALRCLAADQDQAFVLVQRHLCTKKVKAQEQFFALVCGPGRIS